MVSDQETIYLRQRIHQYENHLRWIQMIAGLHYWGGAFEPEHMRQLASMAADALADPRFSHQLPDFDTQMEKSREKAREMADALGLEMSAPVEGGEEDG